MSQEEIYQAAKNRDSENLKQLSKVNSIDMWKKGSYYYSAITQLAFENDRESMEFLLAHGANLSYAVLGAALARNHKLVKDLLSRGADISYAAMGYAEVGERTKAREFMKLGADISKVYLGAAKGLKALRDLCTAESLQKLREVYATKGLMALLDINEKALPDVNEPYQKQIAFILGYPSDVYIPDILFGAVLGGDEDFATQLYGELSQGRDWADEAITKALAFKGKLNNLPEPNKINNLDNSFEAQCGDLTIRANINIIARWRAMSLDPAIEAEMENPVNNAQSNLCNDFYRGWIEAGHINKVKRYWIKEKNLQFHCRYYEWHLLFLKSGHFSAFTNNFDINDNPSETYTTERLQYGDLKKINSNITRFKLEGGGSLRSAYEAGGYHITNLSAGFGLIRSRNRNYFRQRLVFTLPFIDAKHLPELFQALEYKYSQIQISLPIQASMTRRIQLMQSGEISQAEAIILADPQQQGLLQMLAMLALSLPCSLNKVDANMHWSIMQFLFPIELSAKEIKHLGYIAAKQYLSAQLTCYEKQDGNNHRHHAASFKSVLEETKTLEEMKDLVSKQKLVVEGRNPYAWHSRFFRYRQTLAASNPSDRYSEIIRKWAPSVG